MFKKKQSETIANCINAVIEAFDFYGVCTVRQVSLFGYGAVLYTTKSYDSFPAFKGIHIKKEHLKLVIEQITSENDKT